MNSFAVLEGFSSENVQDFVVKQQQPVKAAPVKKVAKPQPKAVKGGKGMYKLSH